MCGIVGAYLRGAPCLDALIQGLPLSQFLPGSLKEGASVTAYNGTLSYFNRAPHPNAAKIFINWFLSRRGQTIYQETHRDRDSLLARTYSPRGQREAIRHRISSRVSRNARACSCRGADAGSGSGQWTRRTSPETVGQMSSASPHSVTTVSASLHGTSAMRFDSWAEMSMPISFIASIAWGLTPRGRVPALHTRASGGAMARANPSAIWLRAELWTQRNSTLRGGAVMNAGGRGSGSVAGRSRAPACAGEPGPSGGSALDRRGVAARLLTRRAGTWRRGRTQAPQRPGQMGRLMRRKPVELLVAEGGKGEGGTLKRSLSMWQLTMISIGATLGTGIFVTYLVPQTLLFIPLADIIRTFQLGNTPWALILTYPTFLIPFCTWLMMGYFKTIPKELEECARIDGATRFGAMVRIIFPIAIPGILSAGIFAFTLSWNEFIYALIFLSSPERKTVPVGVVSELIRGDIYFWGQLMAGALLGSIPVALVYSFFVEYYVTGLTGSVKG